MELLRLTNLGLLILVEIGVVRILHNFTKGLKSQGVDQIVGSIVPSYIILRKSPKSQGLDQIVGSIVPRYENPQRLKSPGKARNFDAAL